MAGTHKIALKYRHTAPSYKTTSDNEERQHYKRLGESNLC